MKGLLYALLFSLVITLSCCEREDVSSIDCDLLRKGLEARNVVWVREALNNVPITYSEQNLQKLAEMISKNCDISATFLCFECIKTNPPQSEIRFSFSQAGVTVERVVDFSITHERRVRVDNVHD